jgi:hypothetical protein
MPSSVSSETSISPLHQHNPRTTSQSARPTPARLTHVINRLAVVYAAVLLKRRETALAADPKFHSPVDDWLSQQFQPFAKTWFELVRTAFVVALLNYVGTKSNSTVVALLALFTYLLFGAYCISFVILSQRPTRSTASNRYVRWSLDGLGLLITGIGLYYWSDIIAKVMDQIMKVQFK